MTKSKIPKELIKYACGNRKELLGILREKNGEIRVDMLMGRTTSCVLRPFRLPLELKKALHNTEITDKNGKSNAYFKYREASLRFKSKADIRRAYEWVKRFVATEGKCALPKNIDRNL